jgi:hypothetical protein
VGRFLNGREQVLGYLCIHRTGVKMVDEILCLCAANLDEACIRSSRQKQVTGEAAVLRFDCLGVLKREIEHADGHAPPVVAQVAPTGGRSA